jgi:hypothetical protein
MFYITSLQFALRAEEMCARIRDVRDYIRAGKAPASMMIDDICINYMALCRDITQCNQVWQYIVGIEYYSNLTLITIYSYGFFFMDVDPVSQMTLGYCMVMTATSFGFIIYAGDLASRKVCKLVCQTFKMLV